MIRVAKRCGRVVLVTNAERGWVELTCQKFLPMLVPLLEDLKVLSARSAYEKDSIAAPSLWKSLAFQSEISRFYGMLDASCRKNVVSLGDSAHERLALLHVTQSM